MLEIEALLTVIEAVPVFDAVTVIVLLVPVVTLPKSKLDPLKARMPDCVCVELEDLAELNPWQPIRINRPHRTSATLQARRSLAAGGGKKRLFIRFSGKPIKSVPSSNLEPDFEGTYQRQRKATTRMTVARSPVDC